MLYNLLCYMSNVLNKKVLKINPEKTVNKIIKFIRDNVKNFNRRGVILGLSGGLDSTVLAYLAVKAVGKKKVLALLMPERDSSKEHLEDAKLIAKNLRIKIKLIDLTPLLAKIGIYKTLPGKCLTTNLKVKALYKWFQIILRKNPFSFSLKGTKEKFISLGTAFYRIKHRVRMILLYYYGESYNFLVLGAANKTEHLTGFYVKYGIDHAVDIMPLQGLYKTQVRQLAKYLNIPEKIIKKAPSPDIIPGINDEYVFGVDYDRLDLILYALDKKMKVEDIAKQLNVKKSKIMNIKNMIRDSEHMRHEAYELKF